MLGKSGTFLLWTLMMLSLGFADHLSAQAQTADESKPGRKEFFAGYSLLSNSFNGHSSFASHQPLNGWELSFAAPVSRGLKLKVSTDGYYGTSLGSPQHPIFILGGATYSRHFGKEVGFVEGLAGLGLLNSDWWAARCRARLSHLPEARAGAWIRR
jgi:hypothetical protein